MTNQIDPKKAYRAIAEHKTIRAAAKALGIRHSRLIGFLREAGRESEHIEAGGLSGYSRFVITSAQNDTETNADFLAALLAYCDKNAARLLVGKYRYKNPTSKRENEAQEPTWDSALAPYFFDGNVAILPTLLLLSVNAQATAENPLSGVEKACRGRTVVVPHPQLQSKFAHTLHDDEPAAAMTTGTLSAASYSSTKAGFKAELNHSFSAVVVEIDSSRRFHFRHVIFDGIGFYDFAGGVPRYYTKDGAEEYSMLWKRPVLVMGDEHAVFIDRKVEEATFGKGGLVDVIDPCEILSHDILDSHATSHHHRNDFFLQASKRVKGMDDMAGELAATYGYVRRTSRPGIRRVFVESNHNDHFRQYLNAPCNRSDFVNAKIYHFASYLMLDYIEKNDGEIPNAFELYTKATGALDGIEFEFLDGDRSYSVYGVELGQHGHIGQGGSRGSRQQYGSLSIKTVIGHSHSPGYEKNCAQVGTSTPKRLGYNKGPNNWCQSHAVVWPNGQVMLVNFIDGKFRI